MQNILVLGAGMVGSAMAIDLSKRYAVSLVDVNSAALERTQKRCPALAVKQLDARDREALKVLAQSSTLVICALPGFLGFETVKFLIECGKNLVDISFFPENALELDELAKTRGVTAFVDCGVAPGMHNLILGYHNESMKISDFECLVGGLPKVKKWPFCYKAPFSPVDVVEEYTRPARYVENGKLVVRPALSDCEFVDFDELGTLEAFNTDGLRSLIYTMPHIPNRKEKTLRYPGHVEYIRVLRDTGFFSTQKIDVNGVLVSPMEVSCKLLFNEWKLGEEEEEFTVMRVKMKGIDAAGIQKEISYTLFDSYSMQDKTSSMARTTGYTATAIASMFLDGLFTGKGIFPPELIGKDSSCFHYIMNYLRERNVQYRMNEIPAPV